MFRGGQFCLFWGRITEGGGSTMVHSLTAIHSKTSPARPPVPRLRSRAQKEPDPPRYHRPRLPRKHV
jgi:hypothetical protein